MTPALRSPMAVAPMLAALAWAGHAAAATLYVKAGAPPRGDGSIAHPFATLALLEGASSEGDSLIVLPAGAEVPALDGGIALKAGQRLLGSGPPVIGRAPDGAAPRISNGNDARLSGDAVRLAERTEVVNLVVTTSRRSAIYGLNAADSRVERNDIADANTSCTPGLLVGFPASSHWAPLANGFAAIMIDADAGHASLVIDGNFIHDASCSDGIDVRTGGSASLVARIDGNVVTRLKQGATVGSLLGIGLQSRDTASLVVNSANNSETYLGNLFESPPTVAWDASWPAGDLAGADCEGLFTHQTGGTIVWNIDRNTFAHGVGGTSCNGAEFFIGAGAAHLYAIVRDSIFEDDPGDMIEENNLGTDSSMDLSFDNVIVRHATHRGPLEREPAVPGLSFAALTSRGVCMSQFSVGPRAATRFEMTRSRFSDCAGDGILAFYANLPGLGSGTGAASAVEIDQSSIVGVGGYAVHWIGYSPLDELRLKVQNSRLAGAAGYPAIAADGEVQGRARTSHIDLGGGALGSLGHNCFDDPDAVQVGRWTGPVTLSSNWWGGHVGPDPVLAHVAGPGVVGTSDAAPLGSAPSSCQTTAN